MLDTAYSAWLDVVLPRVELILGLDYPRWISLQRLIRRTLMRAIDKKPICNGNTEIVKKPKDLERWLSRLGDSSA